MDLRHRLARRRRWWRGVGGRHVRGTADRCSRWGRRRIATLTAEVEKAFCVVPSELNNFVITALHAAVTTVSSSGAVTVQVARVRGGTPVDVLSTAITVDASETSSYTAATAPVINTSNDDVLTGDFLRVDIDGAGTGAKGLIVMATLQPA